ncbi:hypothetical protein CK203_095105 [Vitis vinifera]|uniref:Uncharacterized protein n=1 Tax=Vitis vinifera TaxID=29760 RepID=A0A438DRI3_VITVI|nr:hypothetical protein CK203_095105 [Vitis vinifera]
MPFVYELMHIMKENLIRQGVGDWIFKIIQDRWEKTLKHQLHAAAYFLNPRFQYRRGVGSDPELLQAIYDIFVKLDPTTESFGQFGNELMLFRDAKKGFADRETIAARSTMVPENDRVAEKDYLDLLDISAEVALNSHQEIDFTNAGHSSRPSAAGTSTSGYDGLRVELMMEDEDHGSRRAGPGIGAIGKPYRRR